MSCQDRSLNAASLSAPRLRGSRTIQRPRFSLLKMQYAAENTSLPWPFVATHASTEFRPIAPAPASGLPTSRIMYSQGSRIAQASVLGSDPLHVLDPLLPQSSDSTAVPAAETTLANNQTAQADADRKFTCHLCSKTFARSNNVRRHLTSRRWFSYFETY